MDPLIFKPQIASAKPSNKDACPFCHLDELENIHAKDGEMIWLDNKYPVLEGTKQTIIIESRQHLGDIANYSCAYNRGLFRFAVEKWQEMMASGHYQSVLLFKNYGPISGGSLRHPHMQIVGLTQMDGHEQVSEANLAGYEIQTETETQAQINISTHPIMGFSEFNVRISDLSRLDALADSVQDVVKYVLGDYLQGHCSSYNLFFYPTGQAALTVKVVPRFITSSYFVGYKISQANDTQQMAIYKAAFLASRDS